ncbi:hypothetical protein [Agaribacter marinus]|uniref:Uncharacterized protein n=1 Tax=Agaribacter marinus TaxID=1431249 RepID=A0AA37WK09_9ALTE|nr:hypothetical protein [Agaribacter marinus]GLR70475.1 hypothetical protein GCM10007852_13830 [Agaribacter marinus]
MLIYKRITDFLPANGIAEYLSLYLSSSITIVVCSSAIFGHTPKELAIACFLIFSIVFSSMTLAYIQRKKRAVAFYTEWLQSLSKDEIEQLSNRLKPNCAEHMLIAKLTGTYQQSKKPEFKTFGSA